MEQIDKIALWRERIRECKSSGLPIIEWCNQNGFSKYTFYYWNNRVKLADQEDAPKAGAEFVELHQVFSEATAAETVTPEPEKPVSICISYGDIRISCSTEQEARLAAEFMGRLQERCSKIL